MLKLNYLNEFVALADDGAFLEAANRLGIGQATLSKHIKQLEEELGVPLFQRTTRSVELSEYGCKILPHVREMMAVKLDYETLLQSERDSGAYKLTVGLIYGMDSFNITELLIRFREEHPNIDVLLMQMDSSELEQQVLEGKCEIAFIKEAKQHIDPRLGRNAFASDSLAAILPLAHPLAGGERVRLAELREERFLLLPKGSFMYELCLDSCREAGFSPNIVYTGTGGSNIMHLVEKGFGVSLLMAGPARARNIEGAAVLPVEPAVPVEINLVYAKGNLSEAGQRFMDFCLKDAQQPNTMRPVP